MLQIKSQTDRPRRDTEAARAAARKLLKGLCIADPREIVLEDVAMTERVFVIEGKLQGAEARLIRRGNRGIVRVSSSIPELGRKRFAIAHELGHWILHSPRSHFALCAIDDIGTISDIDMELEANAFAGELLMPSSMFSKRCTEPDLNLVRQLADEYRTTLTAAAIRFVEECDEDCAVVFTKAGKIAWSRSKDGAKIWLKRGTRVQLDELSDVSDVAPMSLTEVQDWFPNLVPSGIIREVSQQSVKLGDYGTVLTLLWIRDEEREDPPDDDDDED